MAAVIKSTFKMDWHGEALLKATRAMSAAACLSGAKKVLADAKVKCPVEKSAHVIAAAAGKPWGKRVPGALRDSGRIATFDKGDAVGAYVVFGGRGYMSKGVDVYYGTFVELGTPGHKLNFFQGEERVIAIPANPFLRKSLAKNRSAIKKDFEAAKMQ